jgi:predicted esterase
MVWMQFSRGQVLEPVAECPAEALVVMLHDRGETAESLTTVALRWAATVPTAAFAIPNGTEHPDPLRHAAAGPKDDGEWRLIDLALRDLDVLTLQQLRHYGLERDRLVLVGVGYGGTLALHMGLRGGVNYASILAFAGKLDRALAQGATSKGKVRLVLQTDEHKFGDGFMGEFMSHLATRGIDARGVLLSGPKLSDTAIRYGAFYLSELVAAAQWRALSPLNLNPNRK